MLSRDMLYADNSKHSLRLKSKQRMLELTRCSAIAERPRCRVH